MDTEQLEKQFSIWHRLLYAALGSVVTLLFSSFDQLHAVVWFLLQVACTASGFYLLWGKPWRALPLSKERINTAFGYLLASLLLLFVPNIVISDFSSYFLCVSGYTIILLVTYQRVHRKHTGSDEMFP